MDDGTFPALFLFRLMAVLSSENTAGGQQGKRRSGRSKWLWRCAGGEVPEGGGDPSPLE